MIVDDRGCCEKFDTAAERLWQGALTEPPVCVFHSLASDKERLPKLFWESFSFVNRQASTGVLQLAAPLARAFAVAVLQLFAAVAEGAWVIAAKLLRV